MFIQYNFSKQICASKMPIIFSTILNSEHLFCSLSIIFALKFQTAMKLTTIQYYLSNIHIFVVRNSFTDNLKCGICK